MPSISALAENNVLASKAVIREKNEDGTPLYPDYMRQ
jgi:hypothetical protein